MSIILDHVNYVYGGDTALAVHALKDINLVIPDGQFIGLIGHTGSGKSTLVQHLNGLIKPTGGSIYFNGEDMLAHPVRVYPVSWPAPRQSPPGASVRLRGQKATDRNNHPPNLPVSVMNQGAVMYDDVPREVFKHYRELEEVGLAAPQVTYIMQALHKNGMPVQTDVTTTHAGPVYE